jgi:MYXO-CTERM domain-containing protein
VAGSEGTCVLAKAGTEVPGSCADGQSCDGTGVCKTKNGQVCAAAADCASGFCVDGVCCDSACTGTCASCNQTGRAGKCTPHAAGTDPQNECGKGTGVCKSTCDGVGSCAYPQTNVTCGNCLLCDGMGTCTINDYSCGYGGSGGYPGSGGRPYPVGGSGGYVPYGGSGGNYGGAGGSIPRSGGAGGGIPVVGGAAGSIPRSGGAGGGIPVVGGAAGSIPVVGGAAGSIPVVGGAAGSIPNVGGAAGSIPKDGSAGNIPPGVGGSGGIRDAGEGDAASTNLHKSGCGCEVGEPAESGQGWIAPFLFAGAAFLLLRRRRR